MKPLTTQEAQTVMNEVVATALVYVGIEQALGTVRQYRFRGPCEHPDCSDCYPPDA